MRKHIILISGFIFVMLVGYAVAGGPPPDFIGPNTDLEVGSLTIGSDGGDATLTLNGEVINTEGVTEVSDAAVGDAGDADTTHAYSKDDIRDYVYLSDPDFDGLPSVLDTAVTGPTSIAIDATPAGAGSIRLPNSGEINWRNFGNDGNLGMYINESDSLMIFGGRLELASTGTGDGAFTVPAGSIDSDELTDGACLSEIADDDGTGSGLDADLLDGNDSTAFLFDAGTDNIDDTHINWGTGANQVSGADIPLSVTNFDGNLSGSDTSIQTALETLDELTLGTGTVDTSGTPVQYDIPRFTDSNTVEGMTYAELAAVADFESALEAVIDLENLQGAVTDAQVPNSITISGGTIENTVIGAATPAAGTFTTVTASSFVTSATAGDRYIEADNGTETLSTSVDDVAGRLAWSDSDSLWHLSDGTDWADFLVTNNSFAGNTETGIAITPQADGTVDAVVSISASEVAAGTLVIESEGISSNDNDTTFPSSAAVKDYCDSVAAGGGLPTTGGTMTGNITLDDGSTDSPSIIFTDETDETATLTKTDSSFLGITTAAVDGVNVLVGNLKVGNGTPGQTLDGEDSYIEGLLEVDGVIHADGGVVGTTLTANYTIVTPQSLSVTADDDVTVGTELTSSVVLCTGDDDSADETLTLQDGVTAGTILTFIIVANVDDTDDAMIIDAETDSTCLGCPDSGIFTYETEGSSLTLYWTGSAWTYQGSVVGE